MNDLIERKDAYAAVDKRIEELRNDPIFMRKGLPA